MAETLEQSVAGLNEAVQNACKKIDELRAQREALLNALRLVVDELSGRWLDDLDCVKQAKSVIVGRGRCVMNWNNWNGNRAKVLAREFDREHCDECDHPIAQHADKYGCQYDRGDAWVEGTNCGGLVAQGPCGCKAISELEAIFHAAEAAQKLLRATNDTAAIRASNQNSQRLIDHLLGNLLGEEWPVAAMPIFEEEL